MLFSALTKNFTWEDLIKDLATFKRWDGISQNLYTRSGFELTYRILQFTIHLREQEIRKTYKIAIQKIC